MEGTKLSSKGQVIIPKHIRSRFEWKTGQELSIISLPNGILLKAKKPFKKTKLDDVAGFLAYKGKPKTLEEMQEAVNKGLAESIHGSG